MSAITRHFRPGNAIFKEGEPSKSMFVIKKGTVAIRKMKGGGFIELARVYTNEVIGELSFFDRTTRSATAIPLTEVEALEIDFASLDKIYKTIPPYFKTIFACVAERLRKADETIKRLQKNVLHETEGVVDTERKPEDTEETSAMLAAVQTDPAESNEDSKDPSSSDE